MGDGEIRLVDHPLVPVVDRKAFWHGFDAFGQDSGRMVSEWSAESNRLSSPAYTREHRCI